MLSKPGLPQKDVPCPTLVDKAKSFFSNLVVNIDIAVLKRCGFIAPGTCNQMCQ